MWLNESSEEQGFPITYQADNDRPHWHEPMTHWFRDLALSCCIAVAAFLVWVGHDVCIAAESTHSVTRREPVKVLLLYSYGHGSRGVGLFDDGLLSAFEAGGLSVNDLYFEFLDLERNKDDLSYHQDLTRLLLRKYAQHKIDLIITGQQPALDYLLREGRDLAPDAPVITVQAPRPDAAQVGSRHVVSQLAKFDIKGTLERAMELFPQTNRVFVVAGASIADRAMAARVADISKRWQGRLTFEYTDSLSLQDTLQRAANLPPHSIILFTQYNRDTSDRVTVAYEVERMITRAANAPVFGLYDFNLIDGGIGGSVIPVRTLGERTGRLALDILNGNRTLAEDGGSVVHEAVPMFDWKQIERWNGKIDALPADAVFVNRPPTLWAQYKSTVVTTLLVFLLLIAMIVALLIQRHGRKQAQDSLRESEEKFRLFAESAPQLVWMCRPDGWNIYFNQRWADYTGLTLEECYGHGWNKPFHPDDQQRAWNAWKHATETGETYDLKCRLRKADGSYHWFVIRGLPLRDDTGQIVKWFGTCTDIDELMLAEEALARESQRSKLLLQNGSDGIHILDPDGNVLEVNNAFCEMLGYTRAELIGGNVSTWDAQWSPADRKQLILKQFNSSGRAKFETRHRRRDGSVLDVEVTGQALDLDGQRVLFNSSRDITERRKAQEQIKHYIAQLEHTTESTLQAMALMVEKRDPYTAGHERRVGDLAAAIGAEMGLPKIMVEGLRLTGYVHDIGKISVPAELLAKPSKLSPVERTLIEGHAQSGFDVLKGIDSPWPLAEVILQHHERLDGSGYPRKLKGDQIIIEARIIAVADVVEAMSSHRPYRPGLGIDAALSEIEKNSGKLYDPQVVAACLRLFRERKHTMLAA